MIILTNQINNVRELESDELIHRIELSSFDHIAHVSAEVHREGKRSRDLIEGRLKAGYQGFFLEKSGEPAGYIWIALKQYLLYDVRTQLCMDEGVGYFFDAAVRPEFRRRGYIGKLKQFAWNSENITAACACVRSDNESALAAYQKLGYRIVATIRCRFLGPIRIHTIRQTNNERTRRRLLVPRPRPRPNPNWPIINIKIQGDIQF